jgi:hypothetical protein
MESMNHLFPDDFESVFSSISSRYHRAQAQKEKIEAQCELHCREDPDKKYTIKDELNL